MPHILAFVLGAGMAVMFTLALFSNGIDIGILGGIALGALCTFIAYAAFKE